MPTRFCRSVRTNGYRCGSPALRGTPYCYYHSNTIQRHRSIRPTAHDSAILHSLAPDHADRPVTMAVPAPLQLDLPMLEDRESIQVALSMLISALAQSRIDPKLGRTLLYDLQVASANAASLRTFGSSSVDSVITTEEGHQIAPDEDPEDYTAWQKILNESDPELCDCDDDECDCDYSASPTV